MTDEIRVWKVGESDWIAARTAAEAERCLFEMIEGEGEPTAEFRREYMDDEPPQILSPYDMCRLTTCEKEPGEPGWEESKVSFKVALENMKKAGEKFPCHFATSEY